MESLTIPLHSRKYPGLFVTIDEDDLEALRAQINAITYRNFKVKGIKP